MRELPDGFKFHQGVDGLIVGLSIVFIVRLEMTISSFIDWRLVPNWSYEPIIAGIKNLKASLGSMADSFTGPIGVGPGGGGGFSMGSAAEVAFNELPFNIPEFAQIIGLPLLFFPGDPGLFLRQLFIILGFWIAVIVPLWFWGLRPALFWWRAQRDAAA